jgi:hypothetical protein
VRKFILSMLLRAQRALSRPAQILSGLFLGAYSVLTAGCAIVMFDWPDPDHALAVGMLGLVIEAGAIWTFIKAADLVFGRKTQGGLIGAMGLRVIAALYALMMIVILATSGPGHSSFGRFFAAFGSAVVIAGLLVVARKRQAVKVIEAARQFKA